MIADQEKEGKAVMTKGKDELTVACVHMYVNSLFLTAISVCD